MGRYMAFQKVDLGEHDLIFRSVLVADQSLPDFLRQTREELLKIKYLSDFVYLHLF